MMLMTTSPEVRGWIGVVAVLATTIRASAVPTDVNPALARSQELISSSNLTAGVEAEAQIKLDLARRKRLERDFKQANQTLTSILESDAPDELQRTALLELALTAQEADQPARAVQILAQYVDRYRDDPNAPEVLLRQGLLYRQMGADSMALSKFYGVMTTVLNLKLDKSGYHERLVLQAQTEIAETRYQEGEFAEAAELFERLLKSDETGLNREEIHLKLIRSLAAAGKSEEAIRHAHDLLTNVSRRDGSALSAGGFAAATRAQTGSSPRSSAPAGVARGRALEGMRWKSNRQSVVQRRGLRQRARDLSATQRSRQLARMANPGVLSVGPPLRADAAAPAGRRGLHPCCGSGCSIGWQSYSQSANSA